MAKSKFSFEKFKDNFRFWEPEWLGKTLAYARPLVVLILIGLAIWAGLAIFGGKRKPATSSMTVRDIKEGANVVINTTNNPLPDLKQGLYVGLSSDRATVGVFKEVTSNIDVELGAGKSYDGEEVIAETRVKLKF